MTLLSKLIKDPLLHFLAAGLMLFAVFNVISPDTADPNDTVIVVDRGALLTFIQYRSKAFQPDIAAERLAALSQADLQRLVEDYVREEALHRQALSLGMDAHDYVIKRRMIQKIEFITTDFASAAVDISEEDVRAYYEANKQDYYIAPYVTFTHVFFDREQHGWDQAKRLAAEKLVQLNRERVPFSDSPRHGDRFFYHTNYVEREPEFVASHFGDTLARQLFTLEPNAAKWHGPFESEYGFHLVLLSDKVAERYPELDEIHPRVVDDARRVAIRTKSEEAIQAIVDRYQVRMQYDAGATGANEVVTDAAPTASIRDDS